MRRPPCRLAILIVLALSGAPGCAAAADDGRLLLRFACLAANTTAPAPPSPSSATPRELAQVLASWDLEADREEVRRVLSLHHLAEVARQATELPAAGGITRGTYAVGERRYAVWLTATPSPTDDSVRLFAEISRDGTVLSAPQIVTLLGQRAILTSMAPESNTPELILVVEVERRARRASRRTRAARELCQSTRDRGASMAHWLVKTEPSTYSFEDLVRAKRARWDGVANAVALKHLRAMAPGDDVLVYHTGDVKAAVGLARVASEPYPDPKAADPKLTVVDLEAVRALPQPVTLAAVKADPAFAEFLLVRQARLSVMPVAPAHWKRLLGMAGA